MYNRQEIIGYLGNDARLHERAEGRYAMILRIGVTKRYLSGPDRQEVTHTEWFNVESFVTERQAEYFRAHALKGALVHAAGETETTLIEGRDGKEKPWTVIRCHSNDIQILRPPRREDDRASDESTTRSARNRKQPVAQDGNRRPSSHQAPPEVNRMDLMRFPD